MSEQEFFGYFIGAVVALVGLFFTVTKPILSLNSKLVENTLQLKAFGEREKEHLKKYSDLKDSHYKLRDDVKEIDHRVDNLEKVVDRHERRISSIDNCEVKNNGF